MTAKVTAERHLRTAPGIDVARCGAREVLFAMQRKRVTCPVCMVKIRKPLRATAARARFTALYEEDAEYYRRTRERA